MMPIICPCTYHLLFFSRKKYKKTLPHFNTYYHLPIPHNLHDTVVYNFNFIFNSSTKLTLFSTGNVCLSLTTCLLAFLLTVPSCNSDLVSGAFYSKEYFFGSSFSEC